MVSQSSVVSWFTVSLRWPSSRTAKPAMNTDMISRMLKPAMRRVRTVKFEICIANSLKLVPLGAVIRHFAQRNRRGGRGHGLPTGSLRRRLARSLLHHDRGRAVSHVVKRNHGAERLGLFDDGLARRRGLLDQRRVLLRALIH